MRSILCFPILLIWALTLSAQGPGTSKKEKTPFRTNLFTGGNVSLAFFGNTFLIGGSPVLGYSLTDYIDLGVVANYTYTRYRDYNGVLNDKLRQTLAGGGGFVRLYPVRFLFLQAQVERNSIRQTFIPVVGAVEKIRVGASSTLIGGGYTTGRRGKGGAPFYYLSILFDVRGDVNSPYTDAYGRAIPTVRGGLQVPLFQGRSRR